MSDETNPVARAVDKVIDAVTDHSEKSEIPGRPGVEPPAIEEATEPRGPLPPKPDQRGPDPFTPTGQPSGEKTETRAQGGSFLTTATGTRLPDTDHSLKAGPRGPVAAARPPPAGEDHPLRPRADPRAGRARPGRGRPRRLPESTAPPPRSPGPPSWPRTCETPGVRAVLHRARVARVGGHRAGHAGVRDQVLHLRRRLRPGGQQHPGLLHPGRHQVPRRHPRRQAAPGPGDPAGADRPRHVLGLRLAAHRGDLPHPVSGTCPTAASRGRTG